ncbi:S-adenosyl-L-methionine-dependent methyltransferase [Aspergillus caelatus]|uniref:Arsenite methyltransferase n=2 Tax=Aspergillus subgen. Circumdati TaxID=2720871 RepID=A0A5N6ZJY9_9EURO|nr:S-adenosyl-L-methionine-dependent methyltransferase [Aspergillus caelatus]KAE8357947.1 S-adenosyl-L-methionine-dependent methyltransferase [Aspergillus caelatus]KAE8421336.1 S-adenosyl-L-methionine-dependent methyltransferase [Aspergillus pseudocaelatus]
MCDNTYNLVQSRYGHIAKQSSDAQQHDKEEEIARAFGYSTEDLSSLPGKTNLGLSCGNPVGFANVKEGETVLDLGSGSGIDVLLAARKVGPHGQAIGVDMTKSMVELAEKNIQEAGISNAKVIQANINSIPLPDFSVDCIISNCVINLVPATDKAAVFKEIARLLKPGGRVAISDILARRPLPDHITNNMALYVGCVAGASQVGQYEAYLKQVGFEGMYTRYKERLGTNLLLDAFIVDTKSDLNLYKGSSYLPQGSCCGGSSGDDKAASDVAGLDFNEWVGSFQIYATKA